MGRVWQKPRHKAGLAGQGTSQGWQVERAQPSWGDGPEGLNRVKEPGALGVDKGPSKGSPGPFPGQPQGTTTDKPWG